MVPQLTAKLDATQSLCFTITASSELQTTRPDLAGLCREYHQSADDIMSWQGVVWRFLGHHNATTCASYLGLLQLRPMLDELAAIEGSIDNGLIPSTGATNHTADLITLAVEDLVRPWSRRATNLLELIRHLERSIGTMMASEDYILDAAHDTPATRTARFRSLASTSLVPRHPRWTAYYRTSRALWPTLPAT